MILHTSVPVHGLELLLAGVIRVFSDPRCVLGLPSLLLQLCLGLLQPLIKEAAPCDESTYQGLDHNGGSYFDPLALGFFFAQKSLHVSLNNCRVCAQLRLFPHLSHLLLRQDASEPPLHSGGVHVPDNLDRARHKVHALQHVPPAQLSQALLRVQF